MSQSLTALYLQNPQLAQAISRRARGQQMMQQGGDSSPIDSPWQGVARLAQALVGGYEQGQADKSIQAAGDEQKALMAQLSAPMPGMQPAPETPVAPMAPRQPVAQQSVAPADLDPLIQKASQETGIPAPLLTGLFAQESGFRPDARNPRSTATGIAQVLDSTAANPGYGMSPLSPEARLDPQQAIPWAAQYLARRGQSLGVTDWTNPQQAERGLRAYGENTPEYAQAVMRRAGMGGTPQGGETIPAQMPAGGAPPAPRTPDAVQHWTSQAAELERRAMIAAQAGQSGIAGILQQQAQGARQMAMARAPQPAEFDQLLRAAGMQPGTPEYQQAARTLIEAKARGPSTNVTVSGGTSYGTQPPAGWRYVREPTATGGETVRLEEIPGGPAEQARAEKEKKAGERDAGAVRSGGIVTQDIDRAIKLMDDAKLPTTGLGAGWLSSIPGTGASDMKSLLEGVGANIAFDKLQQMRESSPTGAALGAVSDTENRMLQSVYGSLAQSQSPQQFKENLGRLKTIYMDIVHGKGKWQETAPPTAPPAPPPGFSLVPAR